MSIMVEGQFGEIEGRKWLLEHGYKVFQADWIAFDGKQYFTIEVKHQDMYKAPPFDGHGLPHWAVNARLAFQRAVGVRAILLVLDKGKKKWFHQYLDVLEAGSHFDTKGQKPRRIYPLENFIESPYRMAPPLL